MYDPTPLARQARAPQTFVVLRVVLALLGLLLAGAVWADPPGRVGRLADVEGGVWIYSPEGGEWVEAERNRPITADDRLSTDAGARAEIRIGSTVLRLGSRSEIEFLQLDDDATNVQLHSGSLAARLRNGEVARAFQLTTAEGRMQPDRAGSYRFDRIDDVSHATVWRGELLFEGRDSAVTVTAGQRAEFWQDGSTQYTLTEPWHDAFERWALARDASEDRSASTRYVSPEMTGVEELDRYGRWEDSPDYGALWIPRYVAPGWAPYSVGRWMWVRPWGWTWLDAAPWGFAPFHYGRWVFLRGSWCWAPGTWVARPVYAPALVGWVGGSHFSLSVAVGSGPLVGWFPLGPHELFVPPFAVSPRFLRDVNVPHVTNIVNVTQIINNPQAVVEQGRYLNRRLPHAVTVVPRDVLERRQPVAPAAARLRDAGVARDIERSPAVGHALVAPPVPTPAPRAREGERPMPGADRGRAIELRTPTDRGRLPDDAPAGRERVAPGRVVPGVASPPPRMTGERPARSDAGARPLREAAGERSDDVPVAPDRARIVPPRPAPAPGVPPVGAAMPDRPAAPARIAPRELPPVRRPPEVIPPRPPGLQVPRPMAPVPPAAVPMPPAISPVPRAPAPVRPAIIPTPGAASPPPAARPMPQDPGQQPRSIRERPDRSERRGG